jgi:hypothetical protein
VQESWQWKVNEIPLASSNKINDLLKQANETADDMISLLTI